MKKDLVKYSTPDMKKCGEATPDEICNIAFDHYDKLSKECHDWLNTIPRAIEIYRKFLKGELRKD